MSARQDVSLTHLGEEDAGGSPSPSAENYQAETEFLETSIMNKVRWGILGAAKIATVKVIPAMQKCRRGEVLGIASRSLPRAQQAARELGLAKAYGSYEELLADAEIDAVYIPLPNHLHVPWSIKALEAGKHVLCEKPIGLSVGRGRAAGAAGRRHPKLKLMEAFMYRHHPQWVTAKRLVTEGKFGPLKRCRVFSRISIATPTTSATRPQIGGGGLMDIGCYPISLSRFLFGSRADDACSRKSNTIPEFRTDRLASGDHGFRRWHGATFTCGTQLAPYQRVQIVGTEGRIEIEIPFNAPPDRPLPDVAARRPRESRRSRCPPRDQYTIQGDLFSAAILDDTPVPTPIEDAVANMSVIEAAVRSGESGHWEVLR